MGPSLKPNQVLITGASGYLGERISQFIHGLGYKVRFGFGLRTPAWATNGALWDFRNIDILDPSQCLDAVDEIDSVIHLASINEIDCKREPRRAIEINSIGTLNLLEASAAAGVKQFIYFSTAHVYGALSGHITEKLPATPTHPYAYSHHLGENLVRSFCSDGKLN